MSMESRKIGVNTVFNAIGGVGVQLITVVTGIFVARHFGAKSFGQLTFVATIIGYFTLITEFGMSTIAIRNVAKTGKPENFLISYIFVRCIIALIAFIGLIILVLAIQFPRDIVMLLFAYYLTIPLQIFKLNWVYYSQQDMLMDNVFLVTEKVAYALSIFTLVYFIKWIVLVPVSIAVSILFVNVISWAVFVRKSEQGIAWRLDGPFMRDMVTHGWPVGVAGAALQTNSNVDSLFVNAYHGNLQTGLYGAAYRLINPVITAGTFFTGAVFPEACKRYEESPSSLSDFIGYSSKLILFMVAPAIITLTVSSREIIAMIFGAEYAGASVPFRLLVWGAGMAIICRLFHNTLVACGKQKCFMKLILISAVFNLICNFILIPPYGIAGAAIATVVTELLLLIMTSYVLGKTLNANMWMHSLPVMGCSLVASASFFLPIPLYINIPIFLTGYIFLVTIFRVFGDRERNIVRLYFRKT